VKRFISILGLLFSISVYSAEPAEESWRLVLEGDPAAGVIHIVCLEGYKFAVYRNRVLNRDKDGLYLGESQSGGLSQIINDKGRGLKCSITR